MIKNKKKIKEMIATKLSLAHDVISICDHVTL